MVPLLSWDHKDAQPIKYLGVHFDYDNSGGTQLQITRSQIHTDLKALLHSGTTPQHKLEVLEAAILSKSRYASKFSSWSMSELEEIDALYSRAYR